MVRSSRPASGLEAFWDLERYFGTAAKARVDPTRSSASPSAVAESWSAWLSKPISTPGETGYEARP